MAQRFKVISLEKNHSPRCYIAEIEFEGRTGKYSISSDASIRYLDDIGMLSILDGQDCPFNGELPNIRITALDFESRQYEKGLEKAFLEFIKEDCSE